MYKFSSLKDHIDQYIAEQISKGELVPGNNINENEICQESKCSKKGICEKK